MGLPFSQVINVARSSTFSIIKSYHFRSMRARWRPVAARHDGNAAVAAAMAISVSSLVNSGHVPITFIDAGSKMQGEPACGLRSQRHQGIPCTWNVWPDTAWTHSPLTKQSSLKSDLSLSYVFAINVNVPLRLRIFG